MTAVHGLHVLLDTHPERLFDRLAAALAAEAAHLPLGTPQIVAVGAKGMARWIEQELAKRHGICAGIEFPFPAKLVQRMLDEAAPREAAVRAAVTREGLRWRIAAMLSEVARAEAVDAAWQPVWSHVRSGGQPDAGRIYEVAAEAARALDALEMHRPEQVTGEGARQFRAGRASPHAGWLLEVRDRIPEFGTDGFAARRRRLLSQSTAMQASDAWPQQIHLFGLSTIPAAWLEILHVFGVRSGRTVHLYRTVPTLHWLDDQRWRSGVEGLAGVQPFVARQIAAGRRMQALLYALDAASTEAFASNQVAIRIEEHGDVDEAGPAPDSLLHRLQRAWRQLAPGPIWSAVGSDASVAPVRSDDSLRLHVVHHPRREMEVLRDEICKALDEISGLRPRDVLVLLPDVEVWAPWIRTVFESSGLPYSIADRPARDALPGVEAWFALTAVLQGRLEAGAVAGLLDLEAWRRVFGIPAADLPRVRRWIEDAGARWGRDAGDRNRWLGGALGAEDFTWRFARDRLVLGWLHGRGGEGVLADYAGPRAPLVEVAADEEAFAGLFVFLDWLVALHEQAATSHAIGRADDLTPAWPDLLGEPISRLLESVEADDAAVLRQLRVMMERIGRGAATHGCLEPVTLDVYMQLVTDAWGEASPRSNFLGRGITFASMTPLRGVPFRVVALAGFGDGAWPRPQATSEFDLLAAQQGSDAGLHPLGDPDRRAEDRLAFLEAVLAARDRLLISWVGRDVRDGKPLPPAPVVGELIDEIKRHVGKERLPLFEHPVHAFGGAAIPATGDVAQAAVRDAAAAHAAAALAASGRRAPSPFWDGQADPAALGEAVMTLDEAARFWASPARAWLRRQGIFVREAEAPLADDDPVDLDRLAEAQLLGQLLADGAAADELALRRLRGEARLPPGETGRLVFDDLQQHVRALRELLPSPTALGSLAVDLLLPADRLIPAFPAGGLKDAVASAGPLRLLGQLGGWDESEGVLWIASTRTWKHPRLRWDATWQAALVHRLRPDARVRLVSFDENGEAAIRWSLSAVGSEIVDWFAWGAWVGRAAPVPWDAAIAAAWADAHDKPEPLRDAKARAAAGFSATAADAGGRARHDLLRRIWGWAGDDSEDDGVADQGVWRWFTAGGPVPKAVVWWQALAPAQPLPYVQAATGDNP